jgi:hypothetical protein
MGGSRLATGVVHLVTEEPRDAGRGAALFEGGGGGVEWDETGPRGALLTALPPLPL